MTTNRNLMPHLNRAPAPRPKFRYYVAFTYQGSDRYVSFDSAEVTLDHPIRSMDDVTAIRQWLIAQGVNRPKVLSFCPFDNGTAGGRAR